MLAEVVGILLFDSSSASQLQRISMTAKTGRINLAVRICMSSKSKQYNHVKKIFVCARSLVLVGRASLAHLYWLARASLFVHATAFLDHQNSFLEKWYLNSYALFDKSQLVVYGVKLIILYTKMENSPKFFVKLFAFFLIVLIYFDKFALCSSFQNGTTHRPYENEQCNSPGAQLYAIDNYPNKFLYCEPSSRRYIIASCPTFNGKPLLFDEKHQQCTPRFSAVRRTPGIPRSSHFGEPCSQNTDCMGNMFCPAGTCLCLPGYIDIGQHCYSIINPGQPGCINNRQCAAIWPGAYCQSGSCQCPANRVPLETKDGVVCHRIGFCPLPDEVIGRPSALPDVHCDSKQPLHDSDCNGMGDLYDCVPDANAAESHCCPNRGTNKADIRFLTMTCIQSKSDVVSSAVGAQSRYWYNSITGNCEQFLYDTTSEFTTANNFLTIEQCQSYCSVTCKRGLPQYVGSAPKQCQSNSQCGSTAGKYQCATVGAKRYCCPSISNFICAPQGGRISKHLAPDPGVGTLTETRWYFDSATKTCQSFIYRGHGGNFNNFLSQQDCMSTCVQNVCEHGEPLRDMNDNVQQCSGGRGCPSSYECRRNVCCPSKQTVCSQPKLFGTCTSAVVRFWYNAATRDCEAFTYTGCNGNDNNFDSYIQCVSFCRDSIRKATCVQGEPDKDSSGKYYTCSITGGGNQCRPNFECYFDGSIYGCCPKKAYTCSLNRAPGSACGASTVRWYFDPTSKVCKTFSYLGCDGNSNNFDTKDRCERYCGVGGCPYGGKPFQDDSMSIRVCNDATITCPGGYECVTVAVSNAAVRYCCPTRASICSQPPNRGTQCGAPSERFYFNPVLKKCTKFTYYGCAGNENNFPSLAQCMNFCSSSACDAGEGIIMDPNSQAAVRCTPGIQNSCPPGYNCRLDSLTNTHICCGATDMGVCPPGERAYVDALTQQVRECQPGATVSCPSNYLCRPNINRNRYFCCGISQKSMCPEGRAPFYDSVTFQPQSCVTGPFNPCPPDYSCQSTTGQREGYCCTIQPICRDGSEYYIEPNTKAPRSCSLLSMGFEQCPSGFTCQTTRLGSNTGYCCRTSSESRICSAGLPYYEGNIPKACTPGIQSCPPGYNCIPSASMTGMHYCCSTGAIDGCPPGTVAHLINGIPQYCHPVSGPQCQAGYTCQYTSAGRYQCCGVATMTVCPAGAQAYTDPVTRQLLQCTPGSICPAGYICTPSSTGLSYCCSSSVVGPQVCQGNAIPYINPQTGQPQQCAAGIPCPVGYTCSSTTSSLGHCCPSSDAQLPSLCPRGNPAPGIQGGIAVCSSGVACPADYTCINSICCPTREKICAEPADSGYSCSTYSPPSSRYFYDQRTRQCSQFYFNGCGGNGNNFLTINECLNYCAGISGAYKCPYPGHEPYYPSPNSPPLFCQPKMPRQCPPGYECHNAGTNFICCGRPGGTTGIKPRCPYPNQQAYIRPGTNFPMRCQPMNPKSCPLSYSCMNGGDGFICCKTISPSSQICPSGSRPYLTPHNNQPMRCSGNTCPRGYRCTYSSVGRGYFCCSSSTMIGTDGCPSGRPYYYPNTNKPLKCQPGLTACPRGFNCVYSSLNKAYQCCSNRKLKSPRLIDSDIPISEYVWKENQNASEILLTEDLPKNIEFESH
ncbi:Uncharacterized protein T06_8406 [Trichinella sp. T6]|nr:Uncharacterized protein T06_8406 [Trichinella sp. T6]